VGKEKVEHFKSRARKSGEMLPTNGCQLKRTRGDGTIRFLCEDGKERGLKETGVLRFGMRRKGALQKGGRAEREGAKVDLQDISWGVAAGEEARGAGKPRKPGT